MSPGRPFFKLKIIFAGTPAFAAAALEALLNAGHQIALVLTQPDRPAGRGLKTRASAVKQLALERGLPLAQPVSLKDPAVVDDLARTGADVMVVVAYGLLLPETVLSLPRLGCLNIHASLLPRWRGAAPIQRAILAGDAESGISIMRIVPALDAGPMWLQRFCAIDPDETGGSLHDKLALLGGAALADALELIVENRVVETPQDDALVTYAAKLTATDRELDWQMSATELDRRVRAFAPVPGVRGAVLGVDCKVLEARIGEYASSSPAGTVLGCDDHGIHVATGAGTLTIQRLQPAGRQPMSAAAFWNGHGARS